MRWQTFPNNFIINENNTFYAETVNNVHDETTLSISSQHERGMTINYCTQVRYVKSMIRIDTQNDYDNFLDRGGDATAEF